MLPPLFRFDQPEAFTGWTSIDDRVMGGVSRSRLARDAAGHAVFEGEVSLDRNGGFASVRSAPAALGRAGATRCVLEVQGDGKQYKLGLHTGDAFDAPSYQAGFQAPVGVWATIELPLAAFRATWRGREVPGAPALDPARIRQLGLLIAGGQAGPFALKVRSVRLE